jgi:hypothetical protein
MLRKFVSLWQEIQSQLRCYGDDHEDIDVNLAEHHHRLE